MTATAQPHRPFTRGATAMNPARPLAHDGAPGTRAETGIGASSIGADMSAAAGPLSFWRITHVPFAAWLAVLERWQLTGDGSELRFGNSQLRGPAGHDPHFGTCQIEVRLARGALRRPLRMRLDIDHWSATSTALTLIPCQRVRPGTAYFQAGRRLLDSLACAAGTLASTAASPARQHTPSQPSIWAPRGRGRAGDPRRSPTRARTGLERQPS